MDPAESVIGAYATPSYYILTGILTTGVLRTDLAVVVVVGGLAAVFVSIAVGDLGLAVVSPVAPRVVLALVVALVVAGSPALVAAEAGHFGPARAVVAAVCAQVPVDAAARALAALVPVAVLAARDEPDLVVFAAAPGALGFVAA